MLTHEVFLDALNPTIVHSSLTCSANPGLAEIVECHLDSDITDLDQLLEGAGHLGFVIPTWAARSMHPCPHCTLVLTPNWAMAA